MEKLIIRLKELRANKKISQKDLGTIVNATQSVVANWENNRSLPSIYDLIELADFYQVSIDYLLGREDEFGHVNIVISPDMALTKDEHNLLVQYKNLSDIDKKRLLQIADTFVEKQ